MARQNSWRAPQPATPRRTSSEISVPRDEARSSHTAGARAQSRQRSEVSCDGEQPSRGTTATEDLPKDSASTAAAAGAEENGSTGVVLNGRQVAALCQGIRGLAEAKQTDMTTAIGFFHPNSRDPWGPQWDVIGDKMHWKDVELFVQAVAHFCEETEDGFTQFQASSISSLLLGHARVWWIHTLNQEQRDAAKSCLGEFIDVMRRAWQRPRSEARAYLRRQKFDTHDAVAGVPFTPWAERVMRAHGVVGERTPTDTEYARLLWDYHIGHDMKERGVCPFPEHLDTLDN